MFSYQWFENNFSYRANQPKRKKKKRKKSGQLLRAAAEEPAELGLGRSSPACSLGPAAAVQEE